MIYEMPNGTQVDAHQIFYVRPWGKETNSGTLTQPLLTPRPIFGSPSPRFEPHENKPTIVDLGEDKYNFNYMLTGGFFANDSTQKYGLWFIGKMEKTEIAINSYMPSHTNPNGLIKIFQCVITDIGYHRQTKMEFNNCGLAINTHLDQTSLLTFNYCTFGSPYTLPNSTVDKHMISEIWPPNSFNRCYGLLAPSKYLAPDIKETINKTIATNSYCKMEPRFTHDWFNEDNQPFGVWFGEYAWRYPKDIFVSTNCLKQVQNLEIVVKNFDGSTWATINEKPINGLKQGENWRGTIVANQFKAGVNVIKVKKQQMFVYINSESLKYVQFYPSQTYSTTFEFSTVKQREIKNIITTLPQQQSLVLQYELNGTKHGSIITTQVKPNTIKIESR